MTDIELTDLCVRFKNALVQLNDEVHVTVILTVGETSHIESTLSNEDLVDVTEAIYEGAVKHNES